MLLKPTQNLFWNSFFFLSHEIIFLSKQLFFFEILFFFFCFKKTNSKLVLSTSNIKTLRLMRRAQLNPQKHRHNTVYSNLSPVH